MITSTHMTQSNALLMIAVAIAFAGCVPLLIALYKRKRDRRLMETGTEAPCFIEEVYERWGAKGNKYYQALVNFTANGTSQRHYFPFTSPRHKTILTKGNTVSIIYDPNKPKRFLIKEVPPSKALLIVTSIIAIGYLVIAGFLYDFIRQ